MTAARSRFVDIDGLAKGAVLAALFNSSPPITEAAREGLIPVGVPIGPPRGEELFEEYGPRFEVLGGRWLHVDLAGTAFDPDGYDERLGQGAAEAAIRPIREAGPDAWDWPETVEEGMAGEPFTRKEARGALPNDTIVFKINTDLDDEEHLSLTGAVDGDRGVILGSSLLPWGEGGVPIPPVICYYVEWDKEPRVVYGVLAECLTTSSQPSRAGAG